MQFPGHIACDSASNSEVVVPIVLDGGRLLGVLDLDSPVLNRFDEEDARGPRALVAAFCRGAVDVRGLAGNGSDRLPDDL